MYACAAVLLLCLAISGHVDGYRRNLAMAEIESLKTALIANWLQQEMAETEDGMYTVCVLGKDV